MEYRKLLKLWLILSAIIATKKRNDGLETGGGAPPKGLTPAEDLALVLNQGRPLVEGS